MPIQSSFGALHIPTNNGNPAIGGTGWISKLDTRNEVRAIVTPAIADPDGTNTVISLIPNYTYLGNTYPSTRLIATNNGTLVSQVDTGIATPRSGSLFRTAESIMMIGTSSAGRTSIARMGISDPLVNYLPFETDLAFYTGIVCSGDTSTAYPPFYTIASANGAGIATITKFSQTVSTVTETWKKTINTLTSGMRLKYIFSRIENATSDIFVAGNLESTTGGFTKIYFAKLDSSGNFLYEKTISYLNDLNIVGFTEGYIMCDDGIFISYNSVTGALISAAYVLGFNAASCSGIVKTNANEVSIINRQGAYIPDLIQAFNFGTVTARQITNITDPDTQWSAIGQIGTNTLTTNNGVVLGGLGITAGFVDFYAITMQVPYTGKIPYSGTYVLDGKTFKYTSVTTVTATNAISDLTLATPSLTWTTTTTARSISGGGGDPTTYTYNKINIGV